MADFDPAVAKTLIRKMQETDTQIIGKAPGK